MNGSLWTAIGEAMVFLIAGSASIWSKRSANKTDKGNDQLTDLRLAIDGIGRKIDRVDDKLDKHISDHIRWPLFGNERNKP